MYNIYSIVILILFDIPRFSVNDLHQIQVAAPSPSSRKSILEAHLGRNMGYGFTYLVGRSASWEERASGCGIFWQYGRFLREIWVKLLHF